MSKIAASREPGNYGWEDWASLLGFLAIIASILIYHSSALPMQIFDESRNANNALELALGHHWLVPTYQGLPDHWNTKPPLLIWMMAGLIRLGLEPMTAIRLPNLVVTVVVACLLYWMFRAFFNDRFAGAVAVLLLLGSYTWMGIHGARTGDYDTLESLFVLLYVLSFWKATEGGKLKAGWLFLWGIFVFLAVLTKGIAGILALPGLALYAILTGRVKMLLKDLTFWAASVTALLLCLGYYLSRELYDPGYLHAVVMNEMSGRYLQVNEGHRESWYYYFLVLIERFPLGILLFPFALVRLRTRNSALRSLIQINLLCSACLLLVLTTSQTKLRWYLIPLIPMLSVGVAAGVRDVLQAIENHSRAPILRRALLALLLLGCLECWYVTQHVTRQMLIPGETNSKTMYGRFLAELEADGRADRILAVDGGLNVSSNFRGYSPVLSFYSRLAREKGLVVTAALPGEVTIAPGTWVMTCDPNVRQWLLRDYSGIAGRENRYCLLEQVTGMHKQTVRTN